jgi:hypothetical protein
MHNPVWSVLVEMFSWPGGIVVGNLIASILWALPAWLILLRKLHCAEARCLRPGRFPVQGTTYHTCRKHTTRVAHDALFEKHAARHPEQHAHLNS